MRFARGRFYNLRLRITRWRCGRRGVGGVGLYRIRLDLIDLAILVAVNPGFSGQKFAPNTAARFAELKELIAESGREILAGIDGGVVHENIAGIAALAPDYVVSGSALFSGGDLLSAVEKFNRILRQARAVHGNAE